MNVSFGSLIVSFNPAKNENGAVFEQLKNESFPHGTNVKSIGIEGDKVEFLVEGKSKESEEAIEKACHFLGFNVQKFPFSPSAKEKLQIASYLIEKTMVKTRK